MRFHFMRPWWFLTLGRKHHQALSIEHVPPDIRAYRFLEFLLISSVKQVVGFKDLSGHDGMESAMEALESD